MYPRESQKQSLTIMRQSRWSGRANPNGSANPTIRQSRCSAMRQSRWSGRSRTTSTRSAHPTSRQSRWSGRTNSSLSPNALDPLEPLEPLERLSPRTMRGSERIDTDLLPGTTLDSALRTRPATKDTKRKQLLTIKEF